jgi:excisionase family DNA binding protein
MKPLAEHEDSSPGSLTPLLTVADLADVLRVHKKTIYTWVARDAIPHIRLGRRVVFSPADIGRWLGARKEGV